MKPLTLTTVLVLGLTFGTQCFLQAGEMSKVRHLKSWLLDNQIFTEAKFQLLDLPVETIIDSEVADYIERYLRPGRHGTERLLGKAKYYFPIFEAALAAHDLPEALKYLPVVESALRPEVASPVGARGLWQFMPATAKSFDLKIDEWIDERQDPYRASEAAASLLAYLHEQFGDWNLALAAYNCGPGRVRRAIRKAGGNSYEEIKYELPRQTQHYITKFKAAAFAMAYHDFFGLQARPDQHLPEAAGSVVPEQMMTFDDIAERAGIPIQIVRAMNPSYLREVVPQTEHSKNKVWLPAAALSTWTANRHAEKTAPEKTGQEEKIAKSNVAPEETNTPVAALPPLPVRGVKMTTQRPLPKDRSPDKQRKESIAVWHQRQDLRSPVTVE